MKTMIKFLSVCMALILTLTGLVGFAMSASAYNVGDSIWYGTYPQSRVTDEETLAGLNAAVQDIDWKSYGYYSGDGSLADGNMTAGNFMRYADIVYQSQKYRAVTFDRYRPYASGGSLEQNPEIACQRDQGYAPGEV